MAVTVLDAIDVSKHHILGADGFLDTSAGQEAKLDLIIDVSGPDLLNLSWEEKALLVRTFIADRVREGVSFEIVAE